MYENLSYQELLKKKPQPKLFVLEDFIISFFLTVAIVLFLSLIADDGVLSWKLIGIGFPILLIVVFLGVWSWSYYYVREGNAYHKWMTEYVVPYMKSLPKNVLIEESDIVHIGNLDANGCQVDFVLNGKLRSLNAEVEVVEIESPYITCVELEENVHFHEKGDLLYVTLHVSKEDLKKYRTS